MNIKFKFIQTPPGEVDLLKYSIPALGTVCHLLDGDIGTILAVGTAYLNPGDNFNRALGRKIAAGRAIKRLAPTRSAADRNTRGLLWEQLFKMSPKTQRARV